MLFIGFWEYPPGNTDKVIEKFKQRTAEKEKTTEMFPKLVYGPYTYVGQRQGFTVYETDDPDKLMNLAAFYAPDMEWEFLPLIDNKRSMELWVKMKK